MSELTLYDFLPSGNGYKVRLVLSALGIAYRYVDVDILAGASRTAEFLERNPNGKIPVLQWPDGRVLAESNAIIFHLAEGTSLLPADRWQRAQVLQWLFFEQYSHEPFIAVLRFWHKYGRLAEQTEAELRARTEGAYRALAQMEQALDGRAWLVGETLSVADIALFAYTHVADEGGLSLADYPAVRDWLARVQARPGHFPISSRGNASSP